MSRALACAIEIGDCENVQSIIDKGLIDIDACLPAPWHSPALVFAAQQDETAIVEILLRAGARIDNVDVRERTACHVAVGWGHADVLAVLLAHAPSLDLADKDGRTPLDIALYHQYRENIVAMLIKAGAPLRVEERVNLSIAAAKSSAIVRALLDRDVVVSRLRDRFRRTPFHYAADGVHNAALLNTLLSDSVCAADLDLRDASDNTCAHIAAAVGNGQLLRLFIDAGASIECVNRSKRGRSLLHEACAGGSLECVLLLLAVGVNVNKLTKDGETAWHFAARNAPIQSALLAAGADATVVVDSDQVKVARQSIAKTRLDFVRRRALQVCVGLQSRGLDALQMCEILVHACGRVAPLVSFHHWWAIATAVRHFHARQMPAAVPHL